MDPVDIQVARRALEARHQGRRERLGRSFEQARADCERIVAMLIERYPVQRIYQWGSLLDAGRFSEHSDIDLAVEGALSAEQFFALYGDAMAMTEFPLDLVQMEHIDPLHRQSIERKGRLLYDRSPSHR